MELSAELKAKYSWLSMAPNQAWFKAKQGDLEAQYVLGMCHLHGVQQEKSSKSAASWLAKAAAAGHVAAQFQIGLLWLEGKGVTQQDDTEATKWLERAANEGHPEALYNMGVLSIRGTGMPQSGREAANYFLQSAKLGNKEAQLRYAMVLEYEVKKLRRRELERAGKSDGNGQAQEDEESGEDDEDEDGQESDDDYFGTGEGQGDENEDVLQPLQPSDVKGKVRTLLGNALHWLLKAGHQDHGLAQHKAALLYMLGVEPVSPEAGAYQDSWHVRPSVVTWGKSYLHALRVGEVKIFTKMPSVVTWMIVMKPKEVEKVIIGPNLEQAAVWHEKAAKNGVLSSAYAIAMAKETGQGVEVSLDESFSWYKISATGQLGDSEGSMSGVEYVCPHCQTWNPNRRTKETPKGNNRCRRCHEERVFPKDVLIRNPLENIHVDKPEDEEIVDTKKGGNRGKDMTKLVERSSKFETADDQDKSVPGAPSKIKATKVEARPGATAQTDEETNESLVYNVGGGSMLVIDKHRPQEDQEETTKAHRSSKGRHGSAPEDKGKGGPSRPHTNDHSSDAPLIAGMGTMTAAQVRNSIKITQLEFTATPKIMHIFNPVGKCCHVTVKNEATIDSGMFYIEFYLCNKQDEQSMGESAYRTAGKPIYGGRILVPNLEASATAILSMDVGARCPLRIACGQAKLWAGVRPWQAKDLPGANLTQLRTLALQQELVAMLHYADANYYGHAGVQQNVREAIRWYDLCKGTIDKDGIDMASPVSVDVMIMMIGPLPMDLYPSCLTQGYKPAWLALAMNLDNKDDSVSAISLTKFEKEMHGDNIELIEDAGIPSMWMYHAASTAEMAQAQLNLAIWYVHGRHVPKSLPQACFWFERAANAGVQDAQYNLGLLLQQGSGIPIDHKKAAILYQKAVDQGHIDAHLSLGMCYLEGKGVEKDTELAVKLLHIPANKGSAIAQFNLGCLYSRGLGVRKDPRQAVAWYVKAADQGHTEAQICYAMALYRGEGTNQDFEHSARLFEIAGKSGHPQAQYNIGVMYSKGEGVNPDRENAAFWWKNASDQGHGSAQLELGQYYMQLARETLERYNDKRVEKMRQICGTKEYFEKFVMLEKWHLGFGSVKGEMLMSVRLFLRILTDFMLLIPEAISREEALSIMQKIDKLRDEAPEKNFPFKNFCVYMRGIGKVIGIDVDARVMTSPVGMDPWEMEKRNKKLQKKERQEAKQLSLKVKHEMMETSRMFTSLREGKEPSPLRFDASQNGVNSAKAACDEIKAKIQREENIIKAQKVRADSVLDQFKAFKAEADLMVTKKKAQEAGLANQKAERCRLAITKIEEQMDRQQKYVDQYKTQLKRLQRKLHIAEGVMKTVTDEKFDEDVGGFEIEMQKMQETMDKEKEAFIAIRKDATELKDDYIKCAAELFLEAAQRDVAEAQYRLGQLFKGDNALPDKWFPQKEDELEDKDRPGLNAYKQAIQELRLQEEADLRKVMEPFSFQKQIDVKVAGMQRLTAMQFKHVAALGPKHAKLLRHLEHEDPNASLDPESPSKHEKVQIRSKVIATPNSSLSRLNTSRSSLTSASVRPVSSVSKFEVLSIEEYAEQDFLDWRQKRFRVERAAFWMRKSAENGYHEAKVELATMLKNGHQPGDNPRKQNYIPFPRNEERAAFIFKEAAELKNPRGQLEYARCLIEGSGVEANAVEAIDWLKKSVAQDTVEAMFQLGCCYEQGVGVPTDKRMAVQLYKQAAGRQYVDAMIAYARCLETGSGIERDKKAAFDWYNSAADKSAKALMLVGRCYQDGMGVDKDENRAVETYLAAADTHDTAQLQLGLSYQFGIGVRRNAEEAIRWYSRAAEAGNVESMLNLAYCYANGIGVCEDMVIYESWLRKAAQAGSEKATSLLRMQRGEF